MVVFCVAVEREVDEGAEGLDQMGGYAAASQFECSVRLKSSMT